MTALDVRDARERGTSLIEMIVTLSVFLVFLAMVGQTAILAYRQIRISTTRTDDAGQARVAMAEISRAVKTAGPPNPSERTFSLAAGLDARFTAFTTADPLPRCLRIWVEGSGTDAVIKEEVTPPAPDATANAFSCATTGGRTRVLARGVSNSAGAPLFRYFNAAGAQDPAATGLATPVSDAERASVTAVEFTVSVGGIAPGAPPATRLINRVRLPNLYS